MLNFPLEEVAMTLAEEARFASNWVLVDLP